MSGRFWCRSLGGVVGDGNSAERLDGYDSRTDDLLFVKQLAGGTGQTAVDDAMVVGECPLQQHRQTLSENHANVIK